MRFLIALGCGLVFAACGTSVIDSKNYDQTCSADADCSGAFFGDVCGVCLCNNSGLNVKSAMKYAQDVTAAQKLCGPQPAIGCAQCAAPTVACVSGTCQVKK